MTTSRRKRQSPVRHATGKSRRRITREHLLCALYAWDVGGMEMDDKSLEILFSVEPSEGNPDPVFMKALLSDFLENEDFVNDRIRDANSRWRMDRMDRVDVAILRMGVTELFFTDTPSQVVINEAVELAKQYGSATSARFVNGVLDAIRKKRPAG